MDIGEAIIKIDKYITKNKYCFFYEQIYNIPGITKSWFLRYIYTQPELIEIVNNRLIQNRVKIFESTIQKLDNLATINHSAAIALIKIVSDESRKRLSSKSDFEDQNESTD